MDNTTKSGRLQGAALKVPAVFTHARAYPYSCVIGLILLTTFMPMKALGAASGIIVVLVGLFLSQFGQALLRILVALGSFLAVTLIHYLLEPSSIFLGTVLFVVTYSQFALFLLRPTTNLCDGDRTRMIGLLTLACWLQGVLGILQAIASRLSTGTFDLGSGDAVTGTIGLYTSETRGSNVFFSIAILSTALITLSLVPNFKGLVRSLPALVAFVFASVLHLQLVTAIAAAVTTIVMFSLRFLRRRGFARVDFLAPAVMAVTVPLGVLITPLNYGSYQGYVLPEVANLTEGASTQSSPVEISQGESIAVEAAVETTPSARFNNYKLKIAVRTLLELPEIAPHQPVLGVGAGQFNSRAALIATGKYLDGLAIPEAWSGVSQSSQELFVPLFEAGIPQSTGSAWFPYFSVQSLYAELGILGIALVVTAITQALRRLVGSHRAGSGVPALIGLTWFLVGIGFYQNYWEWTQAIVLPVFVLWMAVHRGDEFFLRRDRANRDQDHT